MVLSCERAVHVRICRISSGGGAHAYVRMRARVAHCVYACMDICERGVSASCLRAKWHFRVFFASSVCLRVYRLDEGV